MPAENGIPDAHARKVNKLGRKKVLLSLLSLSENFFTQKTKKHLCSSGKNGKFIDLNS